MSAEWAARTSQPIQPTSTNQTTLFAPENLSLMHFTHNIQVPLNPFCAKNFQTSYNVVPYGDHGTERVKYQTISILQHTIHIIRTRSYIIHTMALYKNSTKPFSLKVTKYLQQSPEKKVQHILTANYF
jgi:hypothetical protein